jgi:DnaJ-class molecular chaperone
MEHKDYFEILHLSRNTSYVEIAIANKKLALKCHPMKHPNQMDMYLCKFQLISEAYEVLSNT